MSKKYRDEIKLNYWETGKNIFRTFGLLRFKDFDVTYKVSEGKKYFFLWAESEQIMTLIKR